MKKKQFIKDLEQAKKNIGVKSFFICHTLLKEDSVTLLLHFKPMAKNYAFEYWGGEYSWWLLYGDDGEIDFIISEKKRFLTDLIQKLEEMTDKEFESILVILKEK